MGAQKHPLEVVFAGYDRSQFEYLIRDAAAISRNDPEVIKAMEAALDDPINYLKQNADRLEERGIELYDRQLPKYCDARDLLELSMIDELGERFYVIELSENCDIDDFFEALEEIETYDLIADAMPGIKDKIDPDGDIHARIFGINELLGDNVCVIHLDVNTNSFPLCIVTRETYALLLDDNESDDEPEDEPSADGNSAEVGFDCGYEDFLAALKTLDNYDMIADVMPTIDMGELAADGDVEVWIEEINGVLDGKAYICCDDTSSGYSIAIVTPETYAQLTADNGSDDDGDEQAARNVINDRELKMNLADTALGLLVQGEDYGELANTKVEFGYLFVIDNHGIESLFKLETDKTTAYFAAQGDKLMRLNFTEELFRSTAEGFLEMHGGNNES